MYGMLEVVIVSDVYPSLACRIPTHAALLRSEPLPQAIGSCRFHHYWHHLLTTKSSFVLFFLIEFIACFCCCGGYALSHIPEAFLPYYNIHNTTIRF